MLAGLSRADTADVSTLFNVTTRVAGSVGIAVFLTLFQVRERADLGAALTRVGAPISGALLANLGGAPSVSPTTLPPAVQHLVATATAQALGETSLALVGLALVGTALALAVPEAERVVARGAQP